MLEVRDIYVDRVATKSKIMTDFDNLEDVQKRQLKPSYTLLFFIERNSHHITYVFESIYLHKMFVKKMNSNIWTPEIEKYNSYIETRDSKI